MQEKARNTWYPAETITDADNRANRALFANMPAQADFSLHAAGGIGLHVNWNKTDYMCFKHEGAVFTLNDGPLKLVDKFKYLGSSVSSNESDINIRLVKT